MRRDIVARWIDGFLVASVLWLGAAGWLWFHHRPSFLGLAGAPKMARGPLSPLVAPSTRAAPHAVLEDAPAAAIQSGQSARAAALRGLTNRVREERLREGVLLAYGPLLGRLQLDDRTRAGLLELLAQERTAAGDALQAARAAGLTSGDSLIAAVEQALQGDREGMARLIGAKDFAQLEAYEKTLPESATVARLTAELGAENALSEAQTTELTQAIFDREPAAFNAHPTFTAAIGIKDAPLSQAMLDAASAFLSAAQFGVLRTIAADQRERAQLQQAWTAAQLAPRR